MEPRTLNEIFFRIVDRRQERLMLSRGATTWLPVSSQEFYRSVAGVARALTSWGVSKGDRVAILSENRPEWATTDFACFLLGAAVVPIYTTLTAQQSAYIIGDSGAKVIFVSTAAQLKKVLSTQAQTGVERIVVMDAIGGSEAVCMKQLMNKGPIGRDPELERESRSNTPDDIESIN
jgi:long-chain acyl-CoA synthetase